MSIASSVRKFFAGRRTNSENSSRGQRVVYVDTTLAGVRANPDTVLEISVVWACVSILGKSIAQLPWRAHRKTGTEASEIADNANIDYLLNTRPNPEMKAFTWREMLVWHLKLWGNFYAEIERDIMNRPIALWPIEPDRVTPRRSYDGTRSLYYEVRNQYGPVTELDPADMYHVQGPTWNGIEGYRTVVYAAQSMGLTMALERFGATFFGQGAQVGGVIENEKTNLDPAGRAALLATFNEKHQGPDKAHKWTYLDGAMKAKPLTVPPDAGQFIQSRQNQIEEICRWFGVPPHKVAHLLRSTNNNIEHQGIEFVTDGILPITILLEQEADYKLIGQRNPQKLFTRIDVRSLQRGDLVARAAFYKDMFDRGVFSSNDICHMEGRNGIGPDGDKRFVSNQLMLLETAGEVPVPGQPGATAGNGTDPNADAPTGGDDAGSTDGPSQGG